MYHEIITKVLEQTNREIIFNIQAIKILNVRKIKYDLYGFKQRTILTDHT